MILKRTANPISREERNKINENWATLERNTNDILRISEEARNTAQNISGIAENARDIASNAETISRQAFETAEQSNDTANYVQSQLDSIIADGDSSAEVVQARADFSNLRERLDTDKEVVQEKIQDIVVNVKDFGAVGDNTNDDAPAIQSAIDYAITNGYFTVYLPKGTYLIKSTLTINNTVKISGSGMLKTTIICDTSDFDAFTMVGSVRGLEMSDFTVRCNQPIAENSALKFDEERGANECFFRNINIFTMKYGINAHERFWNNTFENVRINRCETSIYINSQGGNSIVNLFNRVYSNEPTVESIYMYGTKNVTFLSCNFGSTETGTRFATISTTRNTTFENCNFERISLSQNEGCIVTRGYAEVTINNCTFMTIGLKEGVDRAYLVYTRDTSKATINNCFASKVTDDVFDFYVINTSTLTVLNNYNLPLTRSVVATAKYINVMEDVEVLKMFPNPQQVYTLGYEAYEIVDGYSQGDGVVRNKNGGFLDLSVPNIIGSASYVTNTRIDTTTPSKIFIEWENTGSAQFNTSYFNVADSRSDGQTSFLKQVIENGSFGRKVSVIDLSDVVSNYYVRAHTVCTSVNSTSELKVYKIWTE